MLTASFPAPSSPLAGRVLGALGREIEELGRDLREWVLPPPAVVPAWDRLCLVARFHPPVPLLDLCLMEDGRPLGWTGVEMRADGSLRWIEPPVGPEWARRLLREAVGEWMSQMGAA